MTYYKNSMDAPLTPWFIIKEAYNSGESAAAAYEQVKAAGFTEVQLSSVAEQYEEWLEQDTAQEELGFEDFEDYDGLFGDEDDVSY